MATRTIEGTLDTFSVDTGSEVTYLGATSSGNTGEAVRAFRVNPGGTGDIIVKLDRSTGVKSIEIFQEDVYAGSSAPSGYTGFSNIEQNGKGKGAVDTWVASIHPGRILYEIDGVPEAIALELSLIHI